MPYQFWIPLVALAFAIGFCEKKWCMLKDNSGPSPRPYSWSRVQLAWWSVIILSSFIAIIWKLEGHIAPTLDYSVVILLGISAATTTMAKVIDIPDANKPTMTSTGENFFLDILSDHSGISISRFQTVVFNLVFGIWFIGVVTHNLNSMAAGQLNQVMPIIENPNLALLGLSSATYALIKTTEKKESEAQAEQVQLSTDGSVG
jgi:hypothetical protein